MKYLTREQILLIHSMVIDETGGLHGVRDYHAILGLVDLPKQKVFGKELYPGVFLKAAVYARSIILNHPFLDGNKRTGISAASVFLERNNYVISAREGGLEKLAVRIATNKIELGKIAKWLENNSDSY